MNPIIELIGLFAAAFFAATLIPAQSEAVLALMAASGRHSIAVLLTVATLGNVLGSCVNWWLGREAIRFENRRWFPFTPEALAKARQRYKRLGWPSLMLSWVPIIGDPLTFAAGMMREPWWRFVIVVTLAKGLRYVAVIGITEKLSSQF